MVDIRGGRLRKVGDDKAPEDVLPEHKVVQRLFNTKQIDGVSIDISPEPGQRWNLPSNAGWFTIPNKENNDSKFAVAAATIDVDDWTRLQASCFGYSLTRRDINEWVEAYENDDLPHGHAYFDSAYIPTVDKMVESPQTAPEPVLEVSGSYTVRAQEGRSRGLGAKAAGLSRVPIWVAGRKD